MRVRNRMLQREYVLEAERKLPRDEQTIFVIRGLTYDTQVALQSSMAPKMNIPGEAAGKGEAEWERVMKDSKIEMVMSQGGLKMQYDILSEGLIDILNLIDDEDGTPIEYPKGTPSRQVKAATLKEFYADWLPDDVRVEVANAITKASVLSEDSVKN